MRICRPDSGLEALLSDDLIQTMMRADNVDPYDIRALFNKLAKPARPTRSGDAASAAEGGRGRHHGRAAVDSPDRPGSAPRLWIRQRYQRGCRRCGCLATPIVDSLRAHRRLCDAMQPFDSNRISYSPHILPSCVVSFPDRF
jgi:hypothetical protein